MKPEVTLKYLSYLRNKKNKGEEGFTLIELLVVVIIIGVLAAVALPNLLSQVGKARETEIKNGVGTINRTQQAYHFENTLFGDTQTTLGVAIPTKYIVPASVDGFIAANAGTDATFNPQTEDVNGTQGVDLGVRAHAGAIAFQDGQYSQILCRTVEPSDAPMALTGADATNGTCTGGEEVK